VLEAWYDNLPATLNIGLFTCSGVTTTANTATFDNVAFTGGTADGAKVIQWDYLKGDNQEWLLSPVQ